MLLPIITGLLGVFVGALIGNRLAIGRDKRKEFNELADPIRSKLRNHITTEGRSGFIDRESLELFEDHVSIFKKRRYAKAVEQYNFLYKECYKKNEAGLDILINKELLFSTVSNLLKFVQRK